MAHRSGLPDGDGTHSCGDCAWHIDEELHLSCLFAAPPGEQPKHICDGPACAHFEPPPSCLDCGACCREAFDSVPVDADAHERLPPELVQVADDGWVDMVRVPSLTGCGTRCTALRGDGVVPYTCIVYAIRPDTCRDVKVGSEGCLMARRRTKLSAWGPGWTPSGPENHG